MEPAASVAGNVMPEAGGGEHSLKIGRDLRHLRQNERGQQRETEAGDGHEQTRAEPCNGREMGVQAQRIHERGKEHSDVRHGGHQDAAEEVVLLHGFARRADGVLAVAQPQLGKSLDRQGRKRSAPSEPAAAAAVGAGAADTAAAGPAACRGRCRSPAEGGRSVCKILP